jgi:hypothetical protein
MPKAYALLRRRELRAAKIGGRGDYGIGRDDLHAGIERTHAQTKEMTSIRASMWAQGLIQASPLSAS